MSKLEDCIGSLKKVSGKPDKFEPLKKKMNDRFLFQLSVTIDKIGDLRIGFDNHRNHAQPHIHSEKKGKRNSFAIDSGEILHKNSMSNAEKTAIKNWILPRKDCLEFIYKNVQNCKTKEDFDPLVNAMKKFL